MIKKVFPVLAISIFSAMLGVGIVGPLLPLCANELAYALTVHNLESRDYHYLNTTVVFIEDEVDIFAPQGQMLYNAITSEKSWVELPGVGHGIPSNPDGAVLIQETLLEGLEASK